MRDLEARAQGQKDTSNDFIDDADRVQNRGAESLSRRLISCNVLFGG
jgi:hypothetical protein